MKNLNRLISQHQVILILLISALFMSFGCSQNKSNVVEREGEPEVYDVSETNETMNDAIEKAQATFSQFEEHFEEHHNNSRFYYSLKQGFSTPDGSFEHMWINEIQLVDGKYRGIVNNEALYTDQVAFGDTIVIDKNDLSDWMIVDADNGSAKGGYTIRAIREGMTSGEKQEFDMNYGLKFE